MPKHVYILTVDEPDEIDTATMNEIQEGAADHDTTHSARVERWLGGAVDDAAAQLSSWLPTGWRAYVQDASELS